MFRYVDLKKVKRGIFFSNDLIKGTWAQATNC